MEELHVYLVPGLCWQQGRNLATKTIENDTISLGFVRSVEVLSAILSTASCFRVIPELNIANLRSEIESQLSNQESPLPHSYIFIRNVGRHFTTVRYFPQCTKL